MPERTGGSPDETLVSFNVSDLCTSVPGMVALEVINRKFTGHINQEGRENFLEHTCFILKDKLISLLELVFYNCVFSSQGKFYQQLQRSSNGFTSISSDCQYLYGIPWRDGPMSPMPHTYPLVEKICRYVINIVWKNQVDILFNHLNLVGPHFKFTMEDPGSDSSIPFLESKCPPNSDSTSQHWLLFGMELQPSIFS